MATHDEVDHMRFYIFPLKFFKFTHKWNSKNTVLSRVINTETLGYSENLIS